MQLRVRKPSRSNSLTPANSSSHTAVHKASLSPARRRLLELLQRTNFGHIENLVIQNGEPVLDPPPSIYRDIKFGGENGPRPELGTVDCCLKKEYVELFDLFDRLQNGVIERLDVKHGLPFQAICKEGIA